VGKHSYFIIGGDSGKSERPNAKNRVRAYLRVVRSVLRRSLVRPVPARGDVEGQGRLLYERISPVYAELKAIEAELRDSAGERTAAIGALPSLAAYVLPDIVRAMEREEFGVRVEVRETSDELERLLQRGELQAALMELQPHHADYWRFELVDEPYDVIVYAGHRFAGLPAVSIRDIAEEPLILHPPSCTTRRLFEALIEETGKRPIVKAEVPFGDYLLGYAATGAGITFAPRLVSERLPIGGLKAVPIDDPRAKRTISLVCGSRRIGARLRPFFQPS